LEDFGEKTSTLLFEILFTEPTKAGKNKLLEFCNKGKYRGRAFVISKYDLGCNIELNDALDMTIKTIEDVIGEGKKTKAKRGRLVYTNIPNLPDDKLKTKLIELLMSRKSTLKERFDQLVVLLEMLSEKPIDIVTQNMLRKEWKNRGLPMIDGGLSVSQVLGYEKWAALRQIIEWDIVYADVKDNYRLREERYAEIICDVLMVVEKGIPHR